MAADPLSKPPDNGNGNGSEEKKLNEALGRVLRYLITHAPLPAIVGGVMWFKSGSAPANAPADTKIISAEVQEEVAPLKAKLEKMETDLAEMKGYMRALQLASARSSGGLSGGRFREEALGSGAHN